MSEVDIELGRKKLAWARAHMPIHAILRERFHRDPPLKGVTVAVCSHLEAKTGVFIETLAAAGAEVVFTGSEPHSTQDDVVAALNEQPGLTGYARHGADEASFQASHMAVVEHRPQFILDDAAELTARLAHHRPDLLPGLIGTCEQTTTGVRRLQAMHAEGVMAFPSYAVNDSPMKHYFDNVHGTGESTLSNIAQCTNLLLAGKQVVVAGYGYCGRGLADKARGWHAQVTVTEVEPRRALEAHMNGFRVASLAQAAAWGDLFITATGNPEVIRAEHFEAMKDGAVLANAGHFNIEIDTAALESMAEAVREVRPGIDEYRLSDGRCINVLADGRLANLASPGAMGHPAEVMDQTFATQIMAAVDLVARREELGTGVHPVPDSVDRSVATLKLESLGIELDRLTHRQSRFEEAWRIDDIRAGE